LDDYTEDYNFLILDLKSESKYIQDKLFWYKAKDYKKFKIDKRKFHYSSSILSGQLTKEEAKKMLSSNVYIESGKMKEDKDYICKKLGFSEIEFESIINSAPKNHTDYPSIISFLNKLKKIKHVIQNNR
jgi:glucan biosynthesis protein